MFQNHWNKSRRQARTIPAWGMQVLYPTVINQPNTMSKLTSMHALLVQEIKDLYSAETQLLKALPKMAKAASNGTLKKAIETHFRETEGHVARLEEIATLLEASPRGKSCKAMKGLVEEGEEILKEEGDALIKDLAIIGAAQKVEHYEIASYGTARALAETLGLDEAASLLQATLDEEGETDKGLTAIAGEIVPAALEAEAAAG